MKISKKTFEHKFIDVAPEQLEEGILYISMAYSAAIHKCACGCGNEVLTPFSPTDWKLIYDGKSITLEPSIGNWSLPCQSHYWIIKNEIRFARKWNAKEIESSRKQDKKIKSKYYKRKHSHKTLDYLVTLLAKLLTHAGRWDASPDR